MREIQLTKTAAGFQLLSNWYEKFEQRLTCRRSTRRLETSFGYCDVVATGPAVEAGYDPANDGPPLVLLHGAMAGAPHALGELADLPDRLPIYAVNIPGQSTHAHPVRLQFRIGEYGRWFGEVLEQLHLDQAFVCGASWGGSVALDAAMSQPERFAGLILIVPGSIVRGPVLQGIVKVGLPMLRFKLFPSERNRDRALSGIFTTPDEYWSPYLADAMQHWKIDFAAPPLVKSNDLQGLQAPVFVIAADQDLSFPGEPLLSRAEKVFPQYLGGRLLRDCKHTPSFRPEDRAAFATLFEEVFERVSNAGRESALRPSPSRLSA